QKIICGIDLFASAFFMLTRWEEYVKTERDRYGRFPATAAWCYQNDLPDRPLVNEYAELLWQMLLRLGWKGPRKTQNFRLHLSHDVDHPRLWWSASGRLRTLTGSLLQRRNVREAAWWLKNQFFQARDPYDIFDAWMDFSEANGLVSHFNFLGRRPVYADCYYPLDEPFVRNLIKKINERGHVVGYHPSREAFASPAVFTKELASVQELSAAPVRTGRQHYLCFAAPHTWQQWSDAGMEWDSTLGYPEAEGFRCGICHDFPVFNFLTRQTLPLREKPLLAMDVTLAQYRKYSPEQAYYRLQHLRRQTEKHGGEFVLLWHNSSWNTYFWAPWQEVYREFVKSCEGMR
ncbi:MAG: polysaccharide deacetylase family protein, partial [Thermoanaerobaculia bacterium]|nr:polysaccharide deacetylase family protein [Thermoanaerobaculia bacterium]